MKTFSEKLEEEITDIQSKWCNDGCDVLGGKFGEKNAFDEEALDKILSLVKQLIKEIKLPKRFCKENTGCMTCRDIKIAIRDYRQALLKGLNIKTK